MHFNLPLFIRFTTWKKSNFSATDKSARTHKQNPTVQSSISATVSFALVKNNLFTLFLSNFLPNLLGDSHLGNFLVPFNAEIRWIFTSTDAEISPEKFYLFFLHFSPPNCNTCINWRWSNAFTGHSLWCPIWKYTDTIEIKKCTTKIKW